MRRKLIIGAGLFFVLVTIFGVLSLSTVKRVVPSNAVKIRELVGYAGFGEPVRAAFIMFTNTTTNWIELQISALQADGPRWTNYYEPFARALLVVRIGPHGSNIGNIEFPVQPPPRPWRLCAVAKEELKGKERTIAAVQTYLRSIGGRLRGTPPGSFSKAAIYFGHRTDIIVGEDRDRPKMAGDKSVR